jgi:hypothetical protein
VEKAKKKLGVRSERVSFGKGSHSQWRLLSAKEKQAEQEAKEHNDKLCAQAKEELKKRLDDEHNKRQAKKRPPPDDNVYDLEYWANYKVGDA